MNTEALSVLLTTQPWLLRIMVVTAIVAIAGSLYALATYVQRFWLKKARESANNYSVGNIGNRGLRRELKCWS